MSTAQGQELAWRWQMQTILELYAATNPTEQPIVVVHFMINRITTRLDPSNLIRNASEPQTTLALYGVRQFHIVELHQPIINQHLIIVIIR